jgi:hypothetical protein
VAGFTWNGWQPSAVYAAWSLTPEEVARLDAVSEPPRMYPKWMLDFTRLDRDDPQMML